MRNSGKRWPMAAQLAIRLVVGVVGVVAGGRILLRLNCISNSFIPFQDWSQSYTVHDLHDVHDRFWVTHVHDGGLIQFTQISGAFFFLRCVLGGVSAMVMRRCFGPLGLWAFGGFFWPWTCFGTEIFEHHQNRRDVLI